jgi:hypothetical protein
MFGGDFNGALLSIPVSGDPFGLLSPALAETLLGRLLQLRQPSNSVPCKSS